MARGATSVKRTAELARRRESRRRRIFLICTGLILLALALFTSYTYWLRDSSLVEIKNLEVRGLSSHTEEGAQITSAVESATGEMTTLHLKPELLDTEMSRFPRVASSSIAADFPNSATVTVSLRENGSVFKVGSETLLIATDGTVLGTAGEGTDILPEISTGDPPSGNRLEGRTLAQAEVLGAVPTELRSFVAESALGDNGVEVTMSNGLVLLFGDSSNADDKWRAGAAVIADPELTDVSYVDLTVPRRPAVSGLEDAAATDEIAPEPGN